MECPKCKHEMILVQYIEFDDIKEYLKLPTCKKSNTKYHDWLKDLKEGDLVLTRFTRHEYNKTIFKYYLRIVEEKATTGIKLKHLSKFFSYETGELVYGDINSTTKSSSIYKILEIDSMSDLIIRKHCVSKETFSIKKLNNELSRAIIGDKK